MPFYESSDKLAHNRVGQASVFCLSLLGLTLQKVLQL
jgi:hypothetical protein